MRLTRRNGYPLTQDPKDCPRCNLTRKQVREREYQGPYLPGMMPYGPFGEPSAVESWMNHKIQHEGVFQAENYQKAHPWKARFWKIFGIKKTKVRVEW